MPFVTRPSPSVAKARCYLSLATRSGLTCYMALLCRPVPTRDRVPAALGPNFLVVQGPHATAPIVGLRWPGHDVRVWSAWIGGVFPSVSRQLVGASAMQRHAKLCDPHPRRPLCSGNTIHVIRAGHACFVGLAPASAAEHYRNLSRDFLIYHCVLSAPLTYRPCCEYTWSCNCVQPSVL